MKDNSNISQELLETIERYHRGTMSNDERTAFESKLSEDQEFKQIVDDITSLFSGIENQSLKEELDFFHETIPEQDYKTSASSGFFTFKKLAAAVVILLAVTSFWWFSTPQHEKLYSEYFTPDPGLPTVMSSDSNFEFYDAMVNYKQGDYQVAIDKWNLIENKNDTLHYFLGVAYLANNNEKNAITFLEKAIKTKDFPLLNDAYHYLGLAYLKEDQLDKAKLNLQKSTLKNSKDLLSKLKE